MFGVQNKICGIVADNASNNGTMIKEIKKFKWPQFKGEPTWIRCFAHVLNLIAQAILRPFGSHQVTTFENEEYELDDEDLDADDQVKMFSPETESNQDEEDTVPLAAELLEDDEVELDIEDVEELSDEEEDDAYTSESCRRTLAKFRAIARKLNKSPNSKTLFVDICRERGCVKPHSIGRDVRTQWNSTLLQLKRIFRCSDAILEWQKDRRLGTLRQYHITDADITLANDLPEILQPFYEITLQVSIKGSARLADVVVFIDQITSHLSSAISDKQHAYPPALRNACRGGLQLTNKYYTLTDCSPLYRVAMEEYFKLAKWDQEWIDKAIRLTRKMWETNYKPSAQPPPSKEANPRPKTGVLAQLSGASEARAGNNLTDPLNMWLAGGLHLNEEGLPVNPLKWWIQQAQGGNTQGGLLHMALNVLSCPATTVDVKQAFSFGRDYVSFKRHRLSASSVTRGMTIAFYSKSGKIKPGTLRKWKENQKNEQKKKTKGKSRDK
ncbi:hypothetical protein Pst134EA_021364 [Puccinia striiformis f. sp. tritici]|uniref:hypothetical protein n=1 Tax=Puccinia striiformis f. sp. tritici TaxID=168172 RepID=UPI002007DAE5|nr:hypothetical protein Pst134EA_021364 [Puccinia striiformis f. sp. tritici]KAH9457488.1 hypothetical protein Pst134EA_021364 [Puccinia striiformis f. sp. tritici]